MRVLVVEDSAKLADLLRRGLGAHGLEADVTATGEDALTRATTTAYSVIVLDVMLPGIDGRETCRRLRAAGIATPVLMLTALGAVPERVTGLDSGADDYLTKPFAFQELLARIRALTRRARQPRTSMLEAGSLRLDPGAHRAWRGDTRLKLTAREFALLETLMRRAGETVSRMDLLDDVWDERDHNRSNVIDVYVSYLRDKIDEPFGTVSITAVRGVGYRLERT